MDKVKEEFMLSLIFVGKWIFLGFGILGILYVAVSLAYHKSYFDPIMAKFDLEISEIEEKIESLNNTKKAIESELATTNQEIKIIEENKLPRAEEKIESAKKVISELGLIWWEKLPIPMIEKREDVKHAYKTLEDAETNKAVLVKKKEELEEKRKQSNASIIGLSTEINNAKLDLIDKKREKENAEVDVKGPLLWLASILGLT